MKMSKGFTLVEMMVALALGMLVTLAAVQLFMVNQSTFNVQRSSVETMANGRLAIDLITQAIRRAGFPSPGALGSTTNTVSILGGGAPYTAIPTSATNDINSSGNNVTSAASVNGLGGSSDRLVVQYQPAQVPDVDCEGNSITAADTTVLERYALMQDTDGVPALGCDGPDAGTTGTVIARGVENLQVLLGVDQVANGVAQVTRYMGIATYASLAAPRPPIVAVRVGMLVRGEQASSSTATRTADFYVLQRQISASSLSNDSRLRRVFEGTVEVRNVDSSGV